MPEHKQAQQSKESSSTFRKTPAPTIKISVSHPAAIIQRARINPKSLTHADVMQLQRTIGNRAVGKLLSEIGLIPSKAKPTQPVQMQIMPEEEKEPLQGKFAEPLQRQEISEEEEPLQGKFESWDEKEICPSCIQKRDISEEEPLQTKMENNTGMPDNLKAGVESLSGIDMSDVRVYYNSDKPANVGALAYTQGTSIHVAPGQEKHLPHEAWHVVQQKQGNVKPTLQLKDGIKVNDDLGLESEASVMGGKALKMQPQAATQIPSVLASSVMQLTPCPECGEEDGRHKPSCSHHVQAERGLHVSTALIHYGARVRRNPHAKGGIASSGSAREETHSHGNQLSITAARNALVAAGDVSRQDLQSSQIRTTLKAPAKEEAAMAKRQEKMAATKVKKKTDEEATMEYFGYSIEDWEKLPEDEKRNCIQAYRTNIKPKPQ